MAKHNTPPAYRSKAEMVPIKAAVKKRVLQGAGIKDVANEFGVSASYAQLIVTNLGFRRILLTPQEIKAVLGRRVA